MYKIPLNIGTLAGMVGVSLFLLMYYAGVSPLGIGKLAGFWVPIGAIIWVHIKMKDSIRQSEKPFFRALASGMITVLIWASFKGFCMYIFMTLFEQQVIADYLELLRNLDSGKFFNPSDMQEITEAATPWNLMVGDISNNIVYGSLIALAGAFISRRARA
jgi:hypothetical protein